MHVALLYDFHASRKEPLGDLIAKIHTAFGASGLPEPGIRFSFADSPLGTVSSVDRVIKRYPELKRWVSTASTLPTAPPVRMISNGSSSPAQDESPGFPALLAIAKGVPRSFPFHNVMIHFQAPAFGVPFPMPGPIGMVGPGVLVGDSWWVNGRNRSLTAIASVVADPTSKKLPTPSERVAAVLAACGKVNTTTQIPLPDAPPPEQGPAPVGHVPEVNRAVAAVLVDFRNRMAEVVDRAGLPHDLPSGREALTTTARGQSTGPKKPVLLQSFKPLGYDCKGESGIFTLRRRTPANLTVEISLDVGTWSNSLTASYSVTGLGFQTHLGLPVSKRAMDTRQYQIGDAERWQRIVENLAALVAELDRTFVPAVEAAAGPSPEWYQPQS
jgi:hypothetical protein